MNSAARGPLRPLFDPLSEACDGAAHCREACVPIGATAGVAPQVRWVRPRGCRRYNARILPPAGPRRRLPQRQAASAAGGAAATSSSLASRISSIKLSSSAISRAISASIFASGFARQWRAQFVRRIGQQQPVRTDQLFDPGNGAIETRGELSDLVARPRRLAGSRSSRQFRPQALDAPRQATHDRIRHGDGDRDGDHQGERRRRQRHACNEPASVGQAKRPRRAAASSD
jgi:hypothetical protein